MIKEIDISRALGVEIVVEHKLPFVGNSMKFEMLTPHNQDRVETQVITTVPAYKLPDYLYLSGWQHVDREGHVHTWDLDSEGKWEIPSAVCFIEGSILPKQMFYCRECDERIPVQYTNILQQEDYPYDLSLIVTVQNPLTENSPGDKFYHLKGIPYFEGVNFTLEGSERNLSWDKCSKYQFKPSLYFIQ